ncbi:DUF4203 domain-containing protein [Petropleomorpha daqingensis]|uniref:Lysylphosphatidylglycerol synthetase-like protein (DUF2156 family) n=1 Tax=Petropleomorpha daqingensis TaxID=2026353 RepID=A0A853CCW7_9ACTN|nr:DUF4203 domain-containing protein [Petropleomorpha daqingensis]NYJ04462.1 lysylphosphatidylglycerol synthetase-like protein (DUF2156 family) [Petropleomorpha daqingensis]
MTGVGVLVVGLLLCFAGVASLHLAVLASGFALGWLVAESLGGSVAVTAIVAACAAVVAWILSTLVFRAALLVVGGVAGGVIGAKFYGLLEGGDGNVVIAIVFVLAVAVLTGLATQRFHETALVWVCAFGGAGLALSGLARIWPSTLGFLRTPDTTAEAVIDAAAWIALGALGWSVQRRWLRRKATSKA